MPAKKITRPTGRKVAKKGKKQNGGFGPLAIALASALAPVIFKKIGLGKKRARK